MSRLTHALTLPLQWAAGARRRQRRSLPRSVISVGNLALGGRAKTPLVDALAAGLRAAGLRPAVLLRGYPVTRPSAGPQVLEGQERGPARWLAPVASLGDKPAPAWTLAPRVGDEAAWHAAGGSLVGVHPDRGRAAAAVLSNHSVDVFLLDDGFSSDVRADLDVLVVSEADLDRRSALREAPSAVERADRHLVLGRDLVKAPGALRSLRTGEHTTASGPHTLAAAVADPGSVEDLALQHGLAIGSRLHLRDHHGPSRRRVGRAPHPLLVTEKDAVGWAMALGIDATVLGLELRGVEPVLADALALLGAS